MASTDVTSFFGSIRFVLPLILIFFIAAGSAFACPKHTGKAAYRTKSYSTRNVSYMAPVVITYGGRCSDSQYGTRRVKYVSMRDNGYYEGGTRYVAVRRSVPRTRYVAVRDDDDYVPTRRVRYVVRDDDYDYAPRYVAVRRKPVYAATRYVAVREYDPQPKLVAVRHRDIDDVSYVMTQRVPVVDDYFEPQATRVVAVRNNGCGCAREASYRSSVDDGVVTASPTRAVYRDEVPYTSSVRHIVVKTDDIDGTEQVIYSGSSYDDSAYVDLPDANAPMTSRVAYSDMDDVDFDHHAANYNDVAYVADDDMDAACLPEAYIRRSPDASITRSVSFVADDDDYEVIGGNHAAYVADDVVAPPIRYISSTDDSDLVDTRTIYVDDDAICPEDDADFDTVSFVEANDVDAIPLNYVPAKNVTYVSADSDECSCDSQVSALDNQPISWVDESGLPVDTEDVDTVADLDDPTVEIEIDGSEPVEFDDSV